MSNLSKEFIVETKKEIARLEATAKIISARVKALQDLIRENVNAELSPKTPARNKKNAEGKRESMSEEFGEDSGIASA